MTHEVYSIDRFEASKYLGYLLNAIMICLQDKYLVVGIGSIGVDAAQQVIVIWCGRIDKNNLLP